MNRLLLDLPQDECTCISDCMCSVAILLGVWNCIMKWDS